MTNETNQTQYKRAPAEGEKPLQLEGGMKKMGQKTIEQMVEEIKSKHDQGNKRKVASIIVSRNRTAIAYNTIFNRRQSNYPHDDWAICSVGVFDGEKDLDTQVDGAWGKELYGLEEDKNKPHEYVLRMSSAVENCIFRSRFRLSENPEIEELERERLPGYVNYL